MRAVARLRTKITVSSVHESYVRRHVAVGIQSLKNRAAAELQAAAETYGVDLHASEVVIEPLPVTDAPAPGLLSYEGRWCPQMGSVELRGGMKDGLVLALPSWRDVVEFRLLAPNWREVIAVGGFPDGVVPKVLYRYALAGYDERARRYFFELES